MEPCTCPYCVVVAQGKMAPGEPPRQETLTLRARLASAMGELGYVEKRGRNEAQRYDYVMAADVAGAAQRVLAKHGVAFSATEEGIEFLEPLKSQSGATLFRVLARMVYTFYDSLNGESLVVKSTGEGRDSGDKAIYKAKTGALKYALLQSLLIAAGDDPEATSAEDYEDAGAAAARPAPAVAKAPVPRAPAKPAQPAARADAATKTLVAQLMTQTKTDLLAVLGHYKVTELDDLSAEQALGLVDALRRKLERLNAAAGAPAGKEAQNASQD